MCVVCDCRLIFNLFLLFTAPKTFSETMKQPEQQQTEETTAAAAVHSAEGSNLQS